MIKKITIAFLLCNINSFSQENTQLTKKEKALFKTYYKSSVKFEKSDIDSSYIYAEKAYNLYKKREDTINTDFNDALNQLGRIFFYKEDYKASYSYFKRCFNNAIALNDKKGAYKVKVNMATCQKKLDNMQIALKDYFDVVDYYETNEPSSINLGITHFNIASLYIANKKRNDAETFLKKALPFFKNNKASYIQLQASRIGNFNHFDLNKAFNLTNELINENNYDSIPIYIKATLFNNMGQTMKAKENYEKALDFTFKALDLKKEGNLISDIAIQYNNIGDIYIFKKKYASAIKYLDTAIEKASTNRQKFQVLQNLQKAHKENNNLEKSLEYANAYISLKDSLNEVLTQKEIVELGLKYKTKTKDRIIDKLNNLSLIYKVLIVILFLVSCFIIRFYYIKSKNRKKEIDILQEELNQYNSRNQEIESNFITLKSKAVLNPNNIKYIKSDGHYIEFYLKTKAKPEIDRNTITNILKILPQSHFVRVHKSYIININYLKIINSTKLMLKDGTWLNLSRTYKPILKSILTKE